MNVLKLVKLVYLVDRQALTGHGRPVTFDHFYCMSHGPVVSSTMDCINAVPEDETTPIWSQYIGARGVNHSVALIRDAGSTELSPVEEAIVDSVYSDFGHMSPWGLRDYTHRLPEYREPPDDKKRVPLRYRDVLKAAGWSTQDIRDLIGTLKAEMRAARILG